MSERSSQPIQPPPKQNPDYRCIAYQGYFHLAPQARLSRYLGQLARREKNSFRSALVAARYSRILRVQTNKLISKSAKGKVASVERVGHGSWVDSKNASGPGRGSMIGKTWGIIYWLGMTCEITDSGSRSSWIGIRRTKKGGRIRLGCAWLCVQ